MSDADRDKWNARYEGAPYRMAAGPKAFLLQLASRGLLPKAGRALDIAAGEGQTAAFLAARGLDVDAVDISAVGLAKASRLAEEHGVDQAVHVRCADLEALGQEAAPFGSETYDLITCVHYNQASLVPGILAALAPGGLVAMEILGLSNLQRHRHPSQRYLIADDGIASWFHSLEPLLDMAGWDNDRYVVRFCGHKASTA